MQQPNAGRGSVGWGMRPLLGNGTRHRILNSSVNGSYKLVEQLDRVGELCSTFVKEVGDHIRGAQMSGGKN